MAGLKSFGEIGTNLLQQIASDDQDQVELDVDNEDLDTGDKDNNDDHQDDNDDLIDPDLENDDHDPSDLGDDAPNKDKTRDKNDKTEEKPEKTKPTGAVAEDIFDPAVRLKADRAGNLLNSAGQVVVRAGRERKFFEDAKKRVVAERQDNVRLAANMNNIVSAARELHGRFKALEDNKGMFEKAGLSNEEQLQMLSIATEFKKNPVDGIKKMLTMAHMQGVDLKSLGVAGGIDARTIAEEVKRTVSEQLKPISDRESADQADRERMEEARKTAERFFTDNPDALEVREEMGSDKFNSMLLGAQRKFPHMTLNEIWLRIQLAAKNAPPKTQERDNTQNRRRATEDVDTNRRRPRSRTTGSESFEDIGKSVLRDLRTSLRT